MGLISGTSKAYTEKRQKKEAAQERQLLVDILNELRELNERERRRERVQA